MDITIISSSPHRKGSSMLLVEKFIEGATKAGHNTYLFDAALEPVAPCKGCGACKETGGCIQFDAMEIVRPRLIEADLIVFATPIYYWDMNAQLKALIDRMYAIDADALFGKRYIVLTSSGGGEKVVEPLMSIFENIASYYTWKKLGSLHATGVNTRDQLEETDFPQQAYRLGEGL